MPLPGEQQNAAERVVEVIFAQKVKSRMLAEMFKDLPDRGTWTEYYKVIPQPRALNNIKDKLEKGKYKLASTLHSDIELVFANAIHFNEESSGISNDARTLQGVLKKEWAAAVAAGTLPEIQQEPDDPEPEPAVTSRQPSRLSRDTVPPPPTPTIRILKKTAVSTPVASRTATLTPAPQRVATPQAQQAVLAPQPQVIPAAVPISRLVHPIAASPAPPVQLPVALPGEPDEDGAVGLVRGKQDDEIVKQLEATLPRCPAPGDGGWMELAEGVDPVGKYLSIMNEIREYKDSGGDRAADVLECLPDETTSKMLSFDVPVSVRLIEAKITNQGYSNSREFDEDMSRLFEKARRWHEEGTYSYGRVLVLQRLWHTLTSLKQEDMQVDVTLNRAPVAASLATFKGLTYSPGDWVHLANNETPSKPIVAQVQKIESVDATKILSLTWYWRPEQTVHNANRSFWEREVFKTGYTTSSPMQDIIEPIACQFFPKHIRGRPSPPAWYPGRPLYVCESRYDVSSKSFSPIKNWSSCIPDGIRRPPSGEWEYMPITKFASAGNKLVVPRKLPSPFLKGAAALWKLKRGAGEHVESKQQRDRSITTAVGGPAVVQASIAESLPEETIKHFDRDPYTNELLWFSGAPIEPPRVQVHQPRHSLDYLYFLARQRERQHRGEDMDDNRRKAAVVAPLGVELARLYREVFRNDEVVELDRNGDVEMSA